MTMRFESNDDLQIEASINSPIIGVDLDGVLAIHTKKEEQSGEIGKPIPSMVKRVREWIGAGYNIVIFSARLGQGDRKKITRQIQNWCEENIGFRLPVTDRKDANWQEFWDDKAVQMIPNTGESMVDSFSKK